MGTHRLPSCPVCKGAGVGFLCQKDAARYLACQGCNFIFQSPPPDRNAMVSYADAEYIGGAYADYVEAREMKLRHFRDRLSAIDSWARKGRLLDIGCSCGYFLRVAQDAGFDVTGVEFSQTAIQAADADIQSRIVHGTIDDLLNSRGSIQEGFDLITAFDLIEHLEDPARWLHKIAGLLNPGGVLVLSTPDCGHFLRYWMGSRWPMLQPMQHLSLFSRNSLRAVLAAAGLRVETIGPAYKVLTWRYLVSQLRILNPGLSAVLRTALRCVPSRFADKSRRLNIGEILAVASRQSNS